MRRTVARVLGPAAAQHDATVKALIARLGSSDEQTRADAARERLRT